MNCLWEQLTGKLLPKNTLIDISVRIQRDLKKIIYREQSRKAELPGLVLGIVTFYTLIHHIWVVSAKQPYMLGTEG